MFGSRNVSPVTGLVYLAIIALWAVFLVPWFSRHRDDQIGRRSADRYRRAMNTLARSGNARHRSATEIVHEEEWGQDLPDPTHLWRSFVSVVSPAGKAPRAAALAHRRRNVLMALAAGTGFSVVVTFAVGLPAFLPVVFVLLTAGYVTLLARAVQPAALGLNADRAAETDRLRSATLAAQDRARDLLHPPQRVSGAGDEWSAVATPLPTYVSKPKASKSPRVLDLTKPWNGAAMVEQAQTERDRAAAEKAAAQAQFDREMAALEVDPQVEVEKYANPDEDYGHYRRAANE